MILLDSHKSKKANFYWQKGESTPMMDSPSYALSIFA